MFVGRLATYNLKPSAYSCYFGPITKARSYRQRDGRTA